MRNTQLVGCQCMEWTCLRPEGWFSRKSLLMNEIRHALRMETEARLAVMDAMTVKGMHGEALPNQKQGPRACTR